MKARHGLGVMVVIMLLAGCGAEPQGEASDPGELAKAQQELSSIQMRVSKLESQEGAGSPWQVCGKFSELAMNCSLPKYPTTHYEYAGRIFNTDEPLPIFCTIWNKGMRVYNREPYFVESDDPLMGAKRGGSIYYKGTNAADECPMGPAGWRHHYWYTSEKGDAMVVMPYSAGCVDLDIYCRKR